MMNVSERELLYSLVKMNVYLSQAVIQLYPLIMDEDAKAKFQAAIDKHIAETDIAADLLEKGPSTDV